MCQNCQPTNSKGTNVLGGSPKNGIVYTRIILHAHKDAIESVSALVKIISLEVESCLREAIFVSEVMESIDDVECIRSGRRGVRPGGRVLFKVHDIFKVKDRRGLDGDVDKLRAFVRDCVVAASGESGDWSPDSKKGTHAVRLEVVVNSWCQPFGDAVRSCGSLMV